MVYLKPTKRYNCRHIVFNKRQLNILCNHCDELNNIAELLFNFCEGCTKMASLPQSAFATLKIRSHQENALTRKKNSEEKPLNIFSNNKILELTPVKYNSKLMKSIWGLYNRYSPHNIKKNNANQNESCMQIEQQHGFIVAAFAISEELEMAKNGDVWKFPFAKKL